MFDGWDPQDPKFTPDDWLQIIAAVSGVVVLIGIVAAVFLWG